MRKFILGTVAIVIGLLSAQALGNCYLQYDPATGEALKVCSQNPATSINGFTRHDGMMWKYQQFYQGAYTGLDIQGNYFTIENTKQDHNKASKDCFLTDPSLCAK